MSQNPSRAALTVEIAGLYNALMSTLTGASPAAIRSALAMTVLMVGEYSGHEGQALLDWIEDTTRHAKSAALNLPPPDRHLH